MQEMTMANKDSEEFASVSFEEKVQDWQDKIERQVRQISRGNTARILRMAKKPTEQEFMQTVIVCGIGMMVLGAIGFVILVMMDNVLPAIFRWIIT